MEFLIHFWVEDVCIAFWNERLHLIIGFDSLFLNMCYVVCACDVGPKAGGRLDCVYIGMVTEELDMAALMQTIVETGQEVEESSRVGCFSIIIRVHLGWISLKFISFAGFK